MARWPRGVPTHSPGSPLVPRRDLLWKGIRTLATSSRGIPKGPFTLLLGAYGPEGDHEVKPGESSSPLRLGVCGRFGVAVGACTLFLAWERVIRGVTGSIGGKTRSVFRSPAGTIVETLRAPGVACLLQRPPRGGPTARSSAGVRRPTGWLDPRRGVSSGRPRGASAPCPNPALPSHFLLSPRPRSIAASIHTLLTEPTGNRPNAAPACGRSPSSWRQRP